MTTVLEITAVTGAVIAFINVIGVIIYNRIAARNATTQRKDAYLIQLHKQFADANRDFLIHGTKKGGSEIIKKAWRATLYNTIEQICDAARHDKVFINDVKRFYGVPFKQFLEGTLKELDPEDYKDTKSYKEWKSFVRN